MSFVHLHVHDKYSLLDGLGSAEQYTERAKELGMSCLASTNHGNVDGHLKFQQACDKTGVGPIFGAELYAVPDMTVQEDKERRLHITVLVANETGWRNLLQLITRSNLFGFYKRPRVDPASVLEFSEGLFWMTACSSTILLSDWGQKLMDDLVGKVGPEMVLAEVMPFDYDEQRNANQLAWDFAETHQGVGIVATNDCHYVRAEDSELQEVLLAIQTNAKWTDPKRWKFTVTGLYLKTREEMAEAFVKQGQLEPQEFNEALDLTGEIAEECRRGFPAIPKRKVELPRVAVLGDKTDDESCREICERGFAELIVPHVPKKNYRGVEVQIETYRARLEEEFETIKNLGFQRYFLIVWELIHWCKDNGIMTGPGRGSVGGSLMAYCMGITKVDPLQYGLVFTRFVSPARIDLPDIDMDFEDRKRHLVRKHLEDLYGADNVAGVSTFGTLKGKAAIRDVSRVFDIPYTDVDAAAKSIVTRSEGDYRSDFTISDAFETFEDGKRFKKKHPKVADLAIRIEGQTRGAGQHAAGICISAENLQLGERCSLVRRADNVVANWDKHDIEYFGLMKLDVLGLSALSVLSDAKDMIKRNHGVDIVYEDIPMDDAKVFEEVAAGHTTAAFQLSSFGLQRYCTELQITCFNDIVDATALWRPGTLRAGMTEEFRKRKLGLIEWELIHPIMEGLTKDTFGIILYQEQVMQMAYDLAGMTWKNCDNVRKVISKSQGDSLFASFKKMFVDGCVEKGTLPEEAAATVWDDLSSFGSYGFNKSHSVEYSMITYWDMWLKVHYPAEFMAASLTHCGAEHKDELVKEARRLGLKIVPPKVSTSEPNGWVAKGTSLLTPLREIKGIGEKACEKIKALAAKKRNPKGFFKGSDIEEELPKNIVALLRRVRAFEDDKMEFADEETESIADLFQFDLSQDPMRDVRGIENLLKEYLTPIQVVARSPIKGSSFLVMGRIADLRYSWKKSVKVMTVSKSPDTKASYGGVYAYLRDDSGIQTLSFSKDVYQEKKDAIEHCQDHYVVCEVTRGRGGDMLQCDYIWLQDELTSAQFSDMGVDVLTKDEKPLEVSFVQKLRACEECQLRRPTCKPTPPRAGKWNVMVVMEAPTDSAAYTGNILDGKVEEYLFAELAKLNINRDYLHITSVVKCHVPKGTSMGVREIHKCSKTWLDREVEEVEPVLILLLGNTPLLWATGEDTGITRLNGTTIWNPKFDAWVSFCVSPASAYYTPENRPAFFKGIKSFAGALEALGGHLEPSTEPVERSGGGRQAGIASKNEILGKSGRSPEGMMARMRFAMRQLYYSAGRPVTADDAHQWAQRNGIDFPEKSYPAIWSKGWRKVGHTNSNRPEGHDAYLYTWEPAD